MTGQPPCDDTPVSQPQPGDTGRDHTALLQEAGQYESLHRKDGLLDEGVSAVFGIRRGEADLQALCFDPARFTPQQAREWLLDHGLTPRLFYPAGGG
jgi:hypothetical protein